MAYTNFAEALMEAKRKASLGGGRPLSEQETSGIAEGYAAQASDRVYRKQALDQQAKMLHDQKQIAEEQMASEEKQAQTSGAMTGAATGAYVGFQVYGPPGAVIGGVIGLGLGLFACFTVGTPVEMADGSQKAVEDIEIGDDVLAGGMVIGHGVALAGDIYEYCGVMLSGEHAVLENGKWIRVKDSRLAVFVETTTEEVVYPVVTECHILIAKGIVFADYAETDHGTHVNDEFRLNWLNEQKERNAELVRKYAGR